MSELTPDSTSRRWFITLTGSTHHPSALRAGTDLALAAGAFGQQVTLVFMGGALEFLTSPPTRDDALHRLLGSLPFYEIDTVYALTPHDAVLSFRDDLNIVCITPDDWASAAENADIVVNY